ncbi:MAG: 50S ribosomal protein L18 [Parachlamydiaceae bacterium]|nr:50S ribosomal protein L18 [Parachlamydiaceae bacterium]
MRNAILKKQMLRTKRGYRVRKHINGTASKPRLCVVKSNNHLQAQLIDDSNGATLGAISTCAKEFRGTEFARKNKASGRKLGERIAEMATAKGIKTVIFDRGPFKYHGILAELANAARAGGLQF